jgi:hypothetical protein
MDSELRPLLEWMAGQGFERVRGPLLEAVERLLVAEHAAVHRDLLGEPWSAPRAYQWMRYESPDPINRLIAAGRRLDAEWGPHPAARDEFRRAHAADFAAVLRLADELGYEGLD